MVLAAVTLAFAVIAQAADNDTALTSRADGADPKGRGDPSSVSAAGRYVVSQSEATSLAPAPDDTDGDGLPDSSDACPGEPGPPSDAPGSNGCPTGPGGDYVAPDTTITRKPPKSTTSKKAIFEFTSSDEDQRFLCALDKPNFAYDSRRCTSPKSYTVQKGRHTFVVAAEDSAGNFDGITPATYSWKVKKKRTN